MTTAHPLEAFRHAQEPPMSRQDLAKALGVDRITVWRWEKRLRYPERQLIPRIRQLTGIPLEKLMDFEGAAE